MAPASRLELGDEGPELWFLHANGFPPGCYRRFLTPLARHYRVVAPEQRPLWRHQQPPPRSGVWRLLAGDLLQALAGREQRPVIAVGHSLGAVVSLYAAHQRPDLFRALVLLDPVFLLPYKQLTWSLTPPPLRRRLRMIRRTLRRPVHFADVGAVHAFHADKRAFRRFPAEVMEDFVHAATEQDAAGGLRLRFPPAWEAAIYFEMPAIWRELRRCRLPVIGIRGAESDTLMQDAWRRWAARRPDHRLSELPDCGHLFPLEQPERAATLVRRQLLELL